MKETVNQIARIAELVRQIADQVAQLSDLVGQSADQLQPTEAEPAEAEPEPARIPSEVLLSLQGVPWRFYRPIWGGGIYLPTPYVFSAGPASAWGLGRLRFAQIAVPVLMDRDEPGKGLARLSCGRYRLKAEFSKHESPLRGADYVVVFVENDHLVHQGEIEEIPVVLEQYDRTYRVFRLLRGGFFIARNDRDEVQAVLYGLDGKIMISTNPPASEMPDWAVERIMRVWPVK